MTVTHHTRRLERLFCLLISAIVLFALPARATDPNRTVIQDVLYRADGTTAKGTILISWPPFSTADGKPVAAGTLSTKIGANGSVNIPLIPTQGATPSGTAYKVVISLDDGSSSTESWAVPNLSPTTIAAIRSTQVPATVAMQVVSREYVDQQLASAVRKNGDETIAGAKTFTSSPLVPLPGDAAAAASRGYVDAAIAAAAPSAANVLNINKGGTGTNSFIASRCVRVADDGNSLESSTMDCGGANADTLDGQHASAFLAVAAQATDSDTVDGKHAAELGNATLLQGTPVDAAAPQRGQQPYFDAAENKIKWRSAPVLDVRDYGAICDGTTDNAVALRAAVDALPVSGGVLRITGTCVYSTALNLDQKRNVVLEGGAQNAVGYSAKPHDMLVYTGTASPAISARSTNSFTFRALGLMLKAPGYNGVGIDLSHDASAIDASSFTIEDCWISGDDGNLTAGQTDQSSALILLQDAILGTVRNCHLHWAQRGIRGEATAGHYSNGIKVDTVLFDNLRVAGITDAVQGWTLTSIFCEGTDGTSAPPTHGMPHCYLDENNAGGPAGLQWSGGWIGDAVNVPDAWLSFNGCNGCSFSGIFLVNPYTGGLRFNATTKGVALTGNFISAFPPLDFGSAVHYGLMVKGNELSTGASQPSIARYTCPNPTAGASVELTANHYNGGTIFPDCMVVSNFTLRAGANLVLDGTSGIVGGSGVTYSGNYGIAPVGGTGTTTGLTLNSGSVGTTAQSSGTIALSTSGSAGTGITLTTGGTVDITLNPIGGKVQVPRQINSTVATGTAPLAVASTTAVTNLNADMTDGKHASDFPAAGSCTNQVVTGLNNGAAPTCGSVTSAMLAASTYRTPIRGYCTGAAGTSQVISVDGLGATAIGCSQSTAPGVAGALITAAGTVKNLYVNEGTSQKSGTTMSWTMYKNNASTALTCTVAAGATTCNDVAHSVTVAAGDYLTVKSGNTASSSETLANVSVALELWN